VAPSGRIAWPDDISPLIGRSGEHRIPTYSLAPTGQRDLTRSIASDFRVRLRLTSAPAAGTVGQPVRMIADSFTQFASRYLAAAFTDITVVHPETVGAVPRSSGELLAGGKVVVVEVAERNLLSGTSPILLQPVITEIAHQLSQHPRRSRSLDAVVMRGCIQTAPNGPVRVSRGAGGARRCRGRNGGTRPAPAHPPASTAAPTPHPAQRESR
jgi:hypothetical protein